MDRLKNLKGVKMRESGNVINVNNKEVIVELEPQGGCKSCAINSVCRATGTGMRRLNVNSSGIKVSVGDAVEVETPAKSVISAAFLVFVLPLVISGAAYAIITKLTGNNSLGIAGFFLFFVISELFLWVLDKIIKKKHFFRPVIVNLITRK